MSAIGRTNPFPFQLGGGRRAQTVALESLVDAYSAVFDMSEDKQAYVDAVIEAKTAGILWACNERLRNEASPETMQSALPDWEAATRSVVLPGDTDADRRARVSVKLGGYNDNHQATVEALAGQYVDCGVVPLSALGTPASFMPGLHPGPPGLEFSNGAAVVVLQLTDPTVYARDDLESRVGTAINALHALVPAWTQVVPHYGTDLVLDSSSFLEGLNYGALD